MAKKPERVSMDQQYKLRFLVMPDYIYEDNRLNFTDARIYSFINSYKGEKFYFSNEQLGEMFSVSVTSVSTSVSRLVEFKYINTRYEIKSGGGKIRFITNIRQSDNLKHDFKITESGTSDSLNVHINDNKIKDNKITTGNTNVLPVGAKTLRRTYSFGDPLINEVKNYFLEVFKIPKEDCTTRESRQYWHLLLKESKTGVPGVKWLIDMAHDDEFYRSNITSSKDLYYKRIKIISRKRGGQYGGLGVA